MIRLSVILLLFSGGRYRIRTYDLPHVKRMLIPAELIVRMGEIYYSKPALFCQRLFLIF